MKTKLTLLFNLLFFMSNAQVFQLNENIIASKKIAVDNQRDISTLDNPTRTATQELVKNQYFEKIGEFGNNIYLKKHTKNDTGETIIINKSDIKEKFTETTGRWTFGMLSLPIKIRFGGGSEEENNKRYFDFESGFNIGLSIGYLLNKNYTPEIKSYWVFSIGTSQVRLSPETTNDFLTSEQDNIAFSPTTGLVFQFKNDLQLITIVGFDFLSGEVGSKWVYKDKPFVGIGIGFSAFKFGEKPEPE